MFCIYRGRMSTFKSIMYSDECSPYTGLRYKRSYIAPCIVVAQWRQDLKFLNLKFGGIFILEGGGGHDRIKKKILLFYYDVNTY